MHMDSNDIVNSLLIPYCSDHGWDSEIYIN